MKDTRVCQGSSVWGYEVLDFCVKYSYLSVCLEEKFMYSNLDED